MNDITLIGLGVNLNYMCVGILLRDYFDRETGLQTRDIWICFLPCIYLHIQLAAEEEV